MRDIDVKEVTLAVAECCIDSCNNLPEGVLKKMEAARKEEISPLGCQVLDTIIENWPAKSRCPCVRIRV